MSGRSAGAIVSPDDYIVTAGTAWITSPRASGGKGAIIQSVFSDLVNANAFTQAEAQQIRPYAVANWTVEGQQAGSPPDRLVTVCPTKAAATITGARGMAATVTDFTGSLAVTSPS